MRSCSFVLLASAVTLLPFAARAQQSDVQLAAAPVVPHLVRYTGSLPDVVAGRAVDVRFAVYSAQTGGEPLWAEVQHLSPDTNGKYSVLLGSATALPDAVFSAGEARWVGVTVAGEQESPRTPLTATVYALKAEDAQTLAGHPITDFAMAGVKAKPDTATDITQVNVGTGITGGGTGPTVTVAADTTYFNANYARLAAANAFSAANTFSKPIASTVATGTAPFTIASTTVVPNLNAALLGGLASTAFPQLATQNTYASNQIMAPSAPATTSTGHSSNFLWMNASVWNSTKNAAQNIGFQWRAEPLNNNTASPNANFALLSTVTSATPQETGFKITANGIVTFVPGQTFPGTGTITGITAGTDLTGGGTSGNVTLNLNTAALQTTFDARYAQLGAANTYADPQTIDSTLTATTSTFPNYYTGAITGNNTDKDGTGVAGNAVVSGVVATASETSYGDGNSDYVSVGTQSFGEWGIYGQTNETGSEITGIGVYGYVPTGFAGTSGAYAVDAENDSTVGAGLYAYGPAYGVVSSGIQANSYGVFSTAPEGGWGVYGVSDGASQSGAAILSSGIGSGVWADTAAPYSDSNAGPALYATADDDYSAIFVNDSDNYPTLLLLNGGSAGTEVQPALLTAAGRNGVCEVSNSGDFSCSGSVKTLATTSDNRSLETYAMQSSENWFEDFGSGQLSNGHAHINLEPAFASLVNTGVEYHVFITPQGESEGLYVAEKGSGGFEVREQHKGTSSIAFDYRIVAKRSGHEAERLVDATESMRRMTAPRDRMLALQEQAKLHPELAKKRIPARPNVNGPITSQRRPGAKVRPASLNKH